MIHPRCARCKRPVDLVREWQDDNRDIFWFEFRCHGEIERVSLSHEDVMYLSIEIGDCFVDTKAALPAAPRLLLKGGGE